MLRIDLLGRVALVTGASKGIGAATARALAAAGARVAVHFRSDEEGARAVAGACGEGAVALGADLSRWRDAERLVDEVAGRLGRLDVLVANHGIWKGAPIESMTEAEYEEMHAVNLAGVFALCGAAARVMRAAGGGSIVLVASTAGQRGEAGHSHYASTKGAIVALTKSLAVELAPAAIRVNCVAPGWVTTSMTERVLADPARAPALRAAIPLGRPGTPDEIAAPIAFVASDLAAFITGEIVNVNGGAVLCG